MSRPVPDVVRPRDRDDVLVLLGTALCVVGLLGVTMTRLTTSSHAEVRGLAALTLQGQSRLVGMRVEGARRFVAEAADGGAVTVVRDVPPGADDWVEGTSRGDGTWDALTAHVHALTLQGEGDADGANRVRR